MADAPTIKPMTPSPKPATTPLTSEPHRIVAITGGGAGIGAATAKRFLALGHQVAVMDKDVRDLQASEAALGNAATDQPLLCVSGDCTDKDALQDFFDQIAKHFRDHAHILFNNVGQSARDQAGPFVTSNEATWRFVLEVSLLTAMQASRIAAPAMQRAGWGRIINMSSDAAFVGDSGLADYAAAKMGVVGFTRSLARELAPDGITVNAVSPGAIATQAHERLHPDILQQIIEATPAGFIGDPDDVAAAVAFLASPDARFITGQTLMIDGGRYML